MKTIQSCVVMLLLVLACLSSGGCRTFNWTEADTAKERKNYEEESKGPLFGAILGWFIPAD